MTCPHCQYVMDAFDTHCPRCGTAAGSKPTATQRPVAGQTTAPPNPWAETTAPAATPPATAKGPVQAGTKPEVGPRQWRITGALFLVLGVALTYAVWAMALKSGRFLSVMAVAGPMLTVMGLGCAVFATPFPLEGEPMKPITKVFLGLGLAAGFGNYFIMKGGL